MEIPRSGFAGAVTCTPSACRRSITPFQLDPSAKAPCTRTTVGRDPSCGFMLIVLPPWFSLSLPSCDRCAPYTGGRCSITVDFDDGFGKGLRGFLRQVVPNAPLDDLVLISARECLGIGTGVRVMCTIGIAFEGDGGHGDGWT